MLLICLFLFSKEKINHNNAITKVIALKDDLNKIIASKDDKMMLQLRYMPVSKKENTIMKIIDLGNDTYTIKYSNDMFLCGKKRRAGVHGCKHKVEGLSNWEIDEKDDKSVKISIGKRCLVRKNKHAANTKLKLRRCKNNKKDYLWKIIDVNFPVTRNIREDYEEIIEETIEDEIIEEDDEESYEDYEELKHENKT